MSRCSVATLLVAALRASTVDGHTPSSLSDAWSWFEKNIEVPKLGGRRNTTGTRKLWSKSPWDGNCKQTIPNFDGCIVAEREDLPTMGDNQEFMVHYVMHALGVGNQFLDNVGMFHSALLVEEIGGANVFVIEYQAPNFGPGVMVPTGMSPDGRFVWSNQAYVTWYPSWIRDPFDYFDAIRPVGRAPGWVLNKYFDALPAWALENSGYRMISLWETPEVKSKQYLPDMTCQTFTEWSLAKMWELGADDFTNAVYVQDVYCRNYSPFIVKNFVEVDEMDPVTKKDMEQFYAEFLVCIGAMMLDKEDAVAPCMVALPLFGHVYGFDGVTYYKGDLVPPNYAPFAGDEYAVQRMLLPWQNWQQDAYVGECNFPFSQTSVTQDLNQFIRRGMDQQAIYSGGTGVLVRSLDGLEISDRAVVPATFWVNDIMTPSMLYPGSGGGDGNPMCPNQGDDGFTGKTATCSLDTKTGETGPWNYAQVAFVIGTNLGNIFYDVENMQDPDWNWGVFYPTDSNSVDKRCFYAYDSDGYDCPGGWIQNGVPGFWEDASKLGAGYYDGSGCHFEPLGSNGPAIDQTDAYDESGSNLVSNPGCECNYDLIDWGTWVDQWIAGATSKPGFEYQGWFGGGAAPSWAMDIASCWVRNPRPMINLQNQFYYKRNLWNNGKIPRAEYGQSPESNRPYWGWNEVPVDRVAVSDPLNWDAVVIKLPAAICGRESSNIDTTKCLSTGALKNLEKDLDSYVKGGYLIPGVENIGNRPGSYVVFAREFQDANQMWSREFFCQSWKSPSGWYKIIFDHISKKDESGACFIDSFVGAEKEVLV